MSKKKNTLKDLDEFLKQQAATLVAPTPLSESLKEQVKEEATHVEEGAGVSVASILQDIKTLAEKEGNSFRKKFYDLIIQSLEAQKNPTAEDKMLINTALYLKNPEKWKETIRSYWKDSNH